MKQFSIRDILLAFVIIALALGWWFDRRVTPARFQIHSDNQYTYVLDTATGEVWRNIQSEFTSKKIAK